MYPIIDVHFHYPGINPVFKSVKDLPYNKAKKVLLEEFTLRLYRKFLKVKKTKSYDLINEQFKERITSIIEDSMLDFAVVIGFDGAYNKNGELVLKDSLFFVEDDRVYELAQHPKILAGPSINPAAHNAKERVDTAVKKKAALIKLHPAFQHFDPKNHKDFFMYVKKTNIPILVHVGMEHSLPGVKVSKKLCKLEAMIPILETGCKTILAHGGGTVYVREKMHLQKVLHIAKKYPHAYFDNSALAHPLSKKRLLHMRSYPHIMQKILYGSDYPVKSLPLSFVKTLGRKEAMRLHRINNPIDTDIELKRAIGYPEITFTRAKDVINPHAL